MATGGSGNDSMSGGSYDDTLSGVGGHDTLTGYGGADVLYGGTGNDRLYGGDQNDMASGGKDNDLVDGGTGADILVGGQGVDSLYGGTGNDVILGDGQLLSITDYTSSWSGTATTLQVTNTADGPITLNWIDTSGVQQFVATIAAGQSFSLSTHTGNNYVLVSELNHFLEPIMGAVNQTVTYGPALGDVVYGGADADSILGQYGNDTLYGDDGADTLYGGTGNDSLFGGSGADSLVGDAGADTVYGGSGNDTVNLGDGNDVFGDWSTDESGDDTIDGGAGNDQIIAGAGNDTVYGGDGSDTLSGQTGNDVLYGGSGADHFAITDDHNGDTIFGGEGGPDADIVAFSNYQSSQGVTVTFTGNESGTYAFQGTTGSGTFAEIEGVSGTTYGDTINATGAGSAVTIYGDNGNDVIALGAANAADLVYGGAGNDTITNDIGLNSGSDTIYGGDGRDVISIGVNDVIDGGSGGDDVDTLEMSTASAAVSVTLTSTGTGTVNSSGYSGSFSDIERFSLTAGNDTFSGGNDTVGFEALGGGGSDLITGGAGNDTVFGGGGNDSVYGGTGADTVYGGDGNDSIQGGDGNDWLEGQAGNDTVYAGAGDDYVDDEVGSGNGTGSDVMYGGAGNDQIWSGNDNDTVYGGADNDSLGGEGGEDVLYGDAGNDVLEGWSGNDSLYGGDGNDTAYGGAGADSLSGGANADHLYGGDDNDTLKGGSGNDLLTGGLGRDAFVFETAGGGDLIYDFDLSLQSGQTTDRLDVSALQNPDATPVKAWDVVITDDGLGNAKLTFPEGESVVLNGISPSVMQQPGMMHAAGVPCFASGTRILTPDGERAIDALRVGDLVLTAQGQAVPILWLGQRHLDAAALRAHPQLQPIRLRANGMHGNRRDLILSPQHGVQISGPHGPALMRAAHLARLGLDARVARGMCAVTYHHLLLSQHAVIFAEGARCESFYPGAQALRALQATDLTRLAGAIARGKMPAGNVSLAQAYGPRCLQLLTAVNFKSGQTVRAFPTQLLPPQDQACIAKPALPLM